MVDQKENLKALELILDLVLELQIDHDLSPEVERRLQIIEGLAKYGYDVRAIPDKELMDDWKRRQNESEMTEE